MAKIQPHQLILATCMMASIILTAINVAEGENRVTLDENEFRRLTCSGSLAECMPEGEMLMDSEINQRILADSQNYISITALLANNIPCSIRGQSYTNCQNGTAANIYNRGCSQAGRCGRAAG